MQIFNLGFGEILFVVLLAVIVLGPERIVISSRQAGRWIRAVTSNRVWHEIVATSNELREIPNQLMEETGLTAEMEEIQSGISAINNEISGELEVTQSDLQSLPVENFSTERPTGFIDLPDSGPVPAGNPFRWSESRKITGKM